MVHFVIQWDLPDQKANLTIYANKAKNDWLPTTLAHKGVIEVRNYRNPLWTTGATSSIPKTTFASCANCASSAATTSRSMSGRRRNIFPNR